MSSSPPPNPDSQGTARARQVLSPVSHIAGLPAHVQNALAEVAILRHFPEGQIIYLEGELATSLYILESGWVKASRMSLDGREQVMMILEPGEIFGDVAVLTDTPYPGTVVALEPVTAWAIGKEDMLELIARYPELALAVIRRLGERILHYIGLVEDLSLRSVEARLAHTLLRNAEHSEGRLVVPRRTWTTYDEMANRLGTVRDVLNRALRSLEREGLLRVEKRAIVILDSESLARRGGI